MEVHFTAEQESKLRETAARAGLNPEALITEAVELFLVDAERAIHDLQAAVAEGDADIEAGDYQDFTNETLHDLFEGVRGRAGRPLPAEIRPGR